MDKKSLEEHSTSAKPDDEIIIRLEEDGLNYSDLDNMEYEELKDDFEEDEYYSNLNVYKGRKRSRNFSKREADLLYTIIEDYFDVIENKKTDHKSNRMKNKAWVEITNKFNEHNDDEYKTPLQMKTFYDNLKKKRKRMYKDNGVEEIVLEPIIRSNVKNEILNKFIESSEDSSSSNYIDEYHRKKIELLEIEIEKLKAAKEQQKRLFILQEQKLLLEIEEIKCRIKK